MILKFTKMHGCGNDYIYVNCFEQTVESPEELSRRLSDRHFAVGSDGLVLICPSDIADCKMRIFNADGSEAPMCGNAVRCVGKYVYDRGIAKEDIIKVETLSGIKTLAMQIEDGVAVGATVCMGAVKLWTDAPEALDIPDCPPYTGVDVGALHAVMLVSDVEHFPIASIGPSVEKHRRFPDGVNADFMHVRADGEIDLRIWERGSGETLACGTGACASAVTACAICGFEREKEICVHMRGGDLYITLKNDDVVFMRGPATYAYEGVITL